MGPTRYRRFAIAQRLLAAASLVAFLAATIGVPVVIPVASHKDRSQPYPCMNHPCGCQNAEACWRACCCFTNAEKLVWAAQHGITPPKYVFEAAARENLVVNTATCCQARTKSCCSKENTCGVDHDSPGQGDYDHANSDQQQSGAAPKSWSLGFVSAIAARRCQGQAELWLALGAVALPPAQVELHLTQELCGQIANFSPSLFGISHCPAAPPPRA